MTFWRGSRIQEAAKRWSSPQSGLEAEDPGKPHQWRGRVYRVGWLKEDEAVSIREISICWYFSCLQKMEHTEILWNKYKHQLVSCHPPRVSTPSVHCGMSLELRETKEAGVWGQVWSQQSNCSLNYWDRHWNRHLRQRVPLGESPFSLPSHASCSSSQLAQTISALVLPSTGLAAPASPLHNRVVYLPSTPGRPSPASTLCGSQSLSAFSSHSPLDLPFPSMSLCSPTPSFGSPDSPCS